jgi:sulfotransferase
MSPEGPVGIAVARVLDAIHRGFGDRMLMVPYEALTRDPAGTMGRVYEFLGEEPFTHDFENVEQRVQEDDRAYGFPGLHTIRSRVEPSPSRWRELLGDVAEQYAPLNGFLFPRPLPELSPVNGAIP